MMAAGRTWFDRHLRSLPVDTGPPVRLAREGAADATGFSRLPPTNTVKLELPGTTRTIAQASKLVRTSNATTSALEVFGRPEVKVNATSRGGWSRLIAVLTARTPAGKEIVVSSGGLPTKRGAHAYTIRMIDQATFVPKGSRFSVTIASSSSAQSPANLLYLDLPMVPGARVTLGSIRVRIPVLAKAISH
jgi:predicted acyl esterase